MTDRIDKLKAYLEATPDDSFLEHALALEYIKMGDDDRARGILTTLLKRDPAYTGSYYHLGKLLERQGHPEEAIQWYQQGMEACRTAGDKHAFGELRAAFEELTF